MKFTMIALALLLTGPVFAGSEKTVKNPLQVGDTTRWVRAGDFNCDKPIVLGGSRYCESGTWVTPGKASIGEDPTFGTGGGDSGDGGGSGGE